MMPLLSSTSPESESLDSLEERILRAVELVSHLRKEKEAAEKQAHAAVAEKDAVVASVADLKAENARMAEELENLRAERKQVRTRIEKLLGQMDLLAS